MPVSLRRHIPQLALFLFFAFSPSVRAQTAAHPVSAPLPPPVIPATLDVVTFDIHADGEDHKLIVTPTPSLLRVDAPRDSLSIIYDPRTQYYIGLENRNYTYWEFSWPEVRTAVESSTRYESRLREFGVDGLSGPSPAPDPSSVSVPPPNPAFPSLLDPNSSNNSPSTNASAPPLSDDSGYVWQTTAKKKRIAGFDCVLWTGTSESSQPVQAWCYAGPLPKVQNALAQLRAINEPIALVPVRDLMPPFVFEVNDALAKGGVTPLLITWGENDDKNKFQLVSIKSREGKLSLFTVPRLYIRTTLVTMDGMGNQKPPENKPNP